MKKILVSFLFFLFLLSSVTALGVESITLVDSSSNKIIADYSNLKEDTTVYLEDIPSRINVIANLRDGTGSVKFYLNGAHVRTENSFPFSMFGDFFGNYYSWRPNTQSYSIEVQPFSRNGARGNQGDDFNIVLSFMNQPPAQAPPTDTPDTGDDSGDSDDDSSDSGNDDGNSDNNNNDDGNDSSNDDSSGDSNGGSDQGSTTPPNLDENIIVSDVEIVEIDGDSFIVGWETSRVTSGVVKYGITSGLGDATGNGIFSTQDGTTQHRVEVSGLNQGTVYFYRLEGVDQSNNAYQSRIYLTRTPGTSSDNNDDSNDDSNDGNNDNSGQVNCPTNRPDPLTCGTSGPSVCGFDGTGDEFTYANACSACSDSIVDYYEAGDCQNEDLPGDDTPDNPGTNPPEIACPNPRPDASTCGTTGPVVCGLGTDGIDLTYANACTACVDTLVDSYHVGSCINENLPDVGGDDDTPPIDNTPPPSNFDFGISNFCVAKAGWNADGSCEQVIQDNMVINLNDIDYDFSILANTFGDVDSVMFFINGNHYNTEHVFPWSLNDDVLYFDIQKWEPQVGTYILRAESYDTDVDKSLTQGSGTMGQTAAVTFTIVDTVQNPPANDPPADDTPDNTRPEIACPSPRPDASTCGTSGPVVCGLGIDGIDLTYANACTACVDTLVDSYHVGSCINEGVPGSGGNSGGNDGGTVGDASFSISGFYLTKEDNNPIRELQNGDTIYADEYDTDVRIAARTTGSEADSVIFYRNNNYVNTEKGSPFTLFGSMLNWNSYGQQTIRARVYDIDCEYETDVCSGNEGNERSITLNVQRTNDGSSSVNLADYGITVSPNSVFDTSTTSNGILVDRQSVGSVSFTTSLNSLSGVNIDDAITIENARITVDDSTYPQLDGDACLTFENLGFSNPSVLKDGSTYDDYDSFSYSGGTLRFCVDGFSTYTIVEGSSSNPPPSNSPGQNDLGIDRYYLVNTNTNQQIRELTSGQIVDLADFNHPISIVAEGFGPIECTLVFVSSGGNLQYTRTENLAPWSINGDTNTVDVNAWYPSEGNYVIQFHPYSEDCDKSAGENGGRGTLGTVGSIIVDFRNTQPDPNPVPQNNIVSTRNLNPSTTRITTSDLPSPGIEVRSRSGSRVSPDGKTLSVPAGFQINVYNKDISQPRWPYVGPNGDVFVTDRSTNNIILLRDNDNDGVAEFRRTFATPGSNSLNRPFGMAIHNGYFYVANTGDVRRYSYTVGQESLSGRGTKLADLPYLGQNNHWTRNLIIHPNGQKMYVSVGSAGNAQVEPLPRASVIEMNLDGSNQQTFAYGLRNPTGMDFHPSTSELYVSVLERDQLGNNLPPDYVTRIRRGEFFGYPYTYMTPDRRDTRVPRNDAEAAKTRTPDIMVEAHSTPIGIAFYEGNTFPSKYRNGVFITQRGSWNRDPLSGYKVSFAPFGSNNRPTGSYEEFITGFQLAGTNNIMGRPTGITNLPDGSLLITDDYNSRIYRVQYVG